MQCPFCPIGEAFCYQPFRLPAHITANHKDKIRGRLPGSASKSPTVHALDSHGSVSVSASKSDSMYTCALCVPLLTGCCCSRCVGDSVAGKDGDAPAAMPVCAAETMRETATGGSADIARAREASLSVLLPVQFTQYSYYWRVYRLQALSSVEGPWQCTFCPKSIGLASAVALEKHLRQLHKDRAYFCGHCQFASASVAVVAEHIREHSIPCPHCSMLFQAGAPYNAHIETHEGEWSKPGRKRRLVLVALQVMLCLQLYTVTVLCFLCREGAPKRKHPRRRGRRPLSFHAHCVAFLTSTA